MGSKLSCYSDQTYKDTDDDSIEMEPIKSMDIIHRLNIRHELKMQALRQQEYDIYIIYLDELKRIKNQYYLYY